MPPIKPIRLLFGLTVIMPRLLFPKRTPKSHANESQPNTRRKNNTKNSLENS
jgi:hypothetical protein